MLENVHFGTAGYVITNNAAKVLTQLFLTLSPEDIKPLDVLMFDTFLKGSNLDIYQLTPALCIQDTTLNKKFLLSIVKLNIVHIIKRRKKISLIS